jgi:hypothetical protein
MSTTHYQKNTEQKNPDEFSSEYDDYMRDTPLEARFDPLTLKSLVEEAIPKHRAYDMFFGEYIEERKRMLGWDLSEKKRLSFYLPLFQAMASTSYADMYDLAYSHFVVFISELGLIKFQYDYQIEFCKAKEGTTSLLRLVTSPTRKQYYMQLDKQRICIGSGDNFRKGAAKHFAPSVPDWFYNAISNGAVYLNMTMSDFVYLCWCIGITEGIEEDKINSVVNDDSNAVIVDFNTELVIFLSRIDHIRSQIGELKEYV